MASDNKMVIGGDREISIGNNYFSNRPISLLHKSYSFMKETLNRNMGGKEYVYDGYGAPIGEAYDPYYKTINFVPSYLGDANKNASSDYIDYVKNIYGATTSVQNINEFGHMPMHYYEDMVGTIDTSQLYRTLSNDNLTLALERLFPKWDNGKLRAAEYVFTNPNGLATDTSLGIINGYELVRTLRNSIVYNDDYNRGGFGITNVVYDTFGLKESAVLGNDILHTSFRRSPITGRFEDLSPTSYSLTSPIYSSNFGNDSTIGVYTDYYNSLSPRERSYYDLSLERNLYRPTINVVDTSLINGDENYFSHLLIEKSYENLGYRGFSIESGLIDKSFTNNLQIRYIFHTLTSHTNTFDAFNGGLYEYAEDEYGVAPDISAMSFNPGANFGIHASYGNGLTANDMLKKTNDSFRSGKYKTIISRFHTDYDVDAESDGLQTAVSKKYGMSHGRNLLKVVPDKSQGYENPYCRVWTYHHQYHRLVDTIRPFQQYNNGTSTLISQEDFYNTYGFDNFSSQDKGFGNGRKRLQEHGVRNKFNGLVNITPISPEVSKKSVDVKNCMFSIENLAWKDIFSNSVASRETMQALGLSPEQKGPFGGRIMWFPPYDLSFNENITANWNETNFIGRGEPIFTYTNTKRDGNLSFRLLIDHPAILNYWEGRGRSVSKSVDDIDDPEQQVLRFFAGCEMLTGKPVIKEKEASPHISDDPEPNAATMKMSFFVFYPNDYSGVDDSPNDAIAYLMNGAGAGLVTTSTNGTSDWFPRSVITWSGNVVGGYETLSSEKGISLISGSGSTTNDIITTGVSFRDNSSISYNLAVLKGPQDTISWRNRWYYRADDSCVAEEKFVHQLSYLDQKSYGLNTGRGSDMIKKAYGIGDDDKLYSLADVVAAISLDDELKKTIRSRGLCSEDKVNEIKALLSDYEISDIRCVGMASVQGNNVSDNVNRKRNEKLMYNRGLTVSRWLSKYTTLSNRGISPKTSTGGENGDKIKRDNTDDIINKIYRSARIDIYLKAEETKTVQNTLREYAESGDGDLQSISAQQLYGDSFYNIGANNSMYYRDISANRNVEHRIGDYKIKDKRLHNISDNIGSLAMNLRSSVGNGRISVGGILNSVEGFVNGMRNGSVLTEEENVLYNNFDNGSVGRNVPRDSSDAGYTEMHDRSVDVMSDSGKSYRGIDTTQSNGNPTRYDGESRFFTLLEKEDPVMHSKITDKIKYFDPAFHSISPEGFNARLTFLQQCTRQGPTVGSSDLRTSSNTANNLAFGRAPVCILRIGDFFYTRIIIHSVTVSYDPLVWDLNDEGIGVMPMMAKVDINFSFIGGSSLDGPISRLQNALSFNMYANTEVYDDRAEQAEYDSNGKISKLATFMPPA